MSTGKEAQIFIDGEAGTTGLQIRERLANLPGVAVPSIDPALRKDNDARKEMLRKADLVVLCLPDDAAREAVAMCEELGDDGPRILDASTAHRTSGGWVYGFPELSAGQAEAVRTAKRVANPGCYPTAANLAIAPLVKAGLVDRSFGIICDAKSGVSGAGRKPSLKTSFCEVAENFSAYSILDHRHVPEVLMNSGLDEDEFSFTAQLIPIDRGILETIYFRGTEATTAEALLAAYETAYAGFESVRIYNPGQVPDVLAVARTNYCDIGFKYDAKTRRGVIVSVIDNVGKGAAGQAVQNLNLMFGFHHFEGLA